MEIMLMIKYFNKQKFFFVFIVYTLKSVITLVPAECIDLCNHENIS